VSARGAAVGQWRVNFGAIAFAALVFAFAWPLQSGLENEKSHYALVRALAEGTPWIDETIYETGDYVTNDITYWRGHTYSNKAPGLAMLSLPVYLVAREAGVPDEGNPTRMLWVLSLFGAALSALVVLLLVREAADRVVGGSGTTVAVLLAGSTLLLPFATVFYAHARSAMLVMAAFTVLFLFRDGPAPVGTAAVAGLAAGLAVTTEYPCLLAALVFGMYAALARPRLGRVVAYAAGSLVGFAPLVFYNRWAFGSIWHFSWSGGRPTGGDLPSGEVVGQTHTTVHRLLESLFGFSGLFTMAPVLVVAVAGLVLLARRGFRGEAAAVAAVAAAYVVFNASYGSGFDAWLGGERYLVPMLPLLGLPLACALVRWPATTGALTIVSAVLAIALTASHIRGGTPDWLDPLFDRDFPQTVLSSVGITGWYSMLPFFFLLGVAFGAAVAAAPRVDARPVETLFAGGATLAWAVAAAKAPQLPAYGGNSESVGAYLPVLLVAAALAAFALALSVGVSRRPRPRVEPELRPSVE
jgi:hypothetical protein